VEKRIRISGFLNKGVLTILRDNLRVVMKRQQKFDITRAAGLLGKKPQTLWFLNHIKF